MFSGIRLGITLLRLSGPFSSFRRRQNLFIRNNESLYFFLSINNLCSIENNIESRLVSREIKINAIFFGYRLHVGTNSAVSRSGLKLYR